MHKLKLKKSQLDYFKKLARLSKFEIQAYLIGEVINPHLTIVDSFEYTKEYGTQTEIEVAWYKSEFDRVARKAEERGKRIVGDIHTHVNSDTILSDHDFKASYIMGARVCGVCSVIGGRTKVRFWVPDCALPCEIVYAKKKATS